MKMLLDTELPVGDGREVLTLAARLKYFHKASYLPTTCIYDVEQKILNGYTGNYKDI